MNDLYKINIFVVLIKKICGFIIQIYEIKLNNYIKLIIILNEYFNIIDK